MYSCSTDLPHASDDDVVELLWENGQVVMKRHAGRTRNRSLMPSPTQEKAGEYAVPDFNTIHEDDLVPCWLNRPGEDSLQDDCRPEFFTDVLCPNPKPASAEQFSVPVQRSAGFSQAVRDPKVVSIHKEANLQHCPPSEHDNVSRAGGGGSDFTKFRSDPLFQSSQHWPPSEPKSGSSASKPNSTHKSHCLSSMKNDPLPTRPLQPRNNTGLVNFSHFSRPAAPFNANLQNIGFSRPGSSGVDTFRGSGKPPCTGGNPTEPSVVQSTSCLRSASDEQLISSQAKDDPKPPSAAPQEVVASEQSEADCREDALRNHRSPDQHFPSSSFAASFAPGYPKGKKAFVTSVASSSEWSGDSTEGVSRDTDRGLKRKCQVAEESECQSDDAEDESMDVTRPTMCLKRRRSAEVHNLSERRRRDRINEKMHALQELIPNCNKADKASMLDEAIEYLKTLQLQVQIMAMGTGFCMPPMMFPAGIQKTQPSPISHFSPMGIGMNMGFGVGMHDISRSSGYPLISVPPMQGLQFPCTSVSGLAGLHGLPGTSTQIFGFPGQTLPSSLPRAPFIPLSGFSTTLFSLPDLSGAAGSIPAPNPSLSSSPKDQNHDASLQKAV